MSPPTVMKEVPPGYQTGYYHIVLSNLPFRLEWKELKDFMKPALDDDAHIFVEVFNSSTQGWVRVKGHHNFESAVDYIKRTPLQDRFLFVEDKNATEPVMIKTVVDVSNGMAPRRTQRQLSTDSSVLWQSMSLYPSSSYTDSMAGTSTSSSTSTTDTSYHGTEQYAPTEANGGSVYSATDYFDADSCTYLPANNGYTYYDYGAPNTRSYAPYQRENYYNSGDYSQGVTPYGYPNDKGKEEGEGEEKGEMEMVQMQYRGIIIKSFSHKCTAKEVKGLIHHMAGRDASSIVEIRPATNRTGDFKGHVFVTFGRVSVAKKVKDKLEGYSFQGETLRASMTTEGVSDGTHKSSSSSKTKSSTEAQQPVVAVGSKNMGDGGYPNGKGKEKEKGQHRALADRTRRA